MANTLTLATPDGGLTSFGILVVSWVQQMSDRWIEISATNPSLGERLLRITSPKKTEPQRRLSEFHDKLLSVIGGKLNTNITAYIKEATIPANEVEIDLTKRRVYLMAPV
jgi:hypothetical protein